MHQEFLRLSSRSLSRIAGLLVLLLVLVVLFYDSNIGLLARDAENAVMAFMLTPTLSPTSEDSTDCATQTEIPQAECEALLALYNATNGPFWLEREGWNVTQMPCSWEGVICQDGYVDALYLVDNGLLGDIPAEISNLTNIDTINLSDNRLESLPTSIGALDNLRTLRLNDTLLTSLPEEIGGMDSLFEIYVNNSQLTSLPAGIGNLTGLGTLEAENNQLTAIPPEIGFMNSLRNLHLSDNQISSLPPEFGFAGNLFIVLLDGNQLTELPANIGLLENLATLWLQSNQLTSLPVEIGELTSLAVLHLENNRLTTLPDSFTNLARLSLLDVADNCLRDLGMEMRAFLDEEDPDWEATQNACDPTDMPTSTTTPISTHTPTAIPTTAAPETEIPPTDLTATEAPPSATAAPTDGDETTDEPTPISYPGVVRIYPLPGQAIDNAQDYLPRFQWQPVEGAEWYHLFVATEDYSTIVLDQWYMDDAVCVGTTCTTPEDLWISLPGEFVWWMGYWSESIGDDYTETYDMTTFSIGLRSPQPITEPSPSGTITETSVTLQWAADANALWYRIWVGPADYTTNYIFDWFPASELCTDGVCTREIPVTLAVGDYEWWMETWSPAGYVEWFLVSQFTVAP